MKEQYLTNVIVVASVQQENVQEQCDTVLAAGWRAPFERSLVSQFDWHTFLVCSLRLGSIDESVVLPLVVTLSAIPRRL